MSPSPPQLFVRALPASSLPPDVVSAGLRYIRPVSTESSTYTTDPGEGPVSLPIQKLAALKQAAGEAAYAFDEKQDRDGLYGALAITTVCAGTITAIDTTAAAGNTSTVCVCVCVCVRLVRFGWDWDWW